MPSTPTSLAAHRSLSAGRVATVKQRVLEALESSEDHGCIFDDLRKVFPSSTADGTIRARIIELESEGATFRAGDTRLAPTNCEQLVMRLIKYAPPGWAPLPTHETKPFYAGFKHAIKLARAADPLFTRTAIGAALIGELKRYLELAET